MPDKDARTTSSDPLDSIEHERSEPRPDFSKPLPRQKLPTDLQKTFDSDESWWSAFYEGNASESTDTSVRYAAYASRLRTIMLSAHRYVAYTSDIGESFRPVAHPIAVRAAYGVSWAYLAGDVGYEGYKAYLRNQRTLHPENEPEDSKAITAPTKEKGVGTSTSLGPGITGDSVASQQPEGRVVPIEDYRAVMAQRAVFQGIASMGLPALTIHSIVRYSGRALKNTKNVTMRTWGPIGLGLAAVPALPYMFDEPVEKATERLFHTAFETIGGPDAVRARPVTGKKELRQQEGKVLQQKEKEL